MNNRTSILEELNQCVLSRNKKQIVESRATHVITAAANFLEVLEKNYSEEEYLLLEKRLLFCIKNRDISKFSKLLKSLEKK